MQRLWVLAIIGVSLTLTACNNGSSSPALNNQVIATSGSNVLPITVNLGPTGDVDNIAFATVTVCVPGTSNCQTINNIQIDTGTSGLRILSSALSLPLPQQVDSSGNPVVECLQFVASYSWGPVQTASVQMAGEPATTMPIQVIGAPTFPAVPDACSSTGPSADTVQTFGANGLLGIGVFRQDCGLGCAFAGASNPNLYYTCPPSSACQPAAVGLLQQVQSPVWLLPIDNNGVIVELPPVLSSGQTSASGSLVFGIGTQSNNALGSATTFDTDANGLFSTVYQGQTYAGTIFDTGSDALYFLDSGTSGLALCRDLSFYYCPATPQNQTAVVHGASGANSGTIAFGVTSADTLFADPALAAFNDLAGPNPDDFDWGLPFFFGRNVFAAIESQTTSAGVGPYWAF